MIKLLYKDSKVQINISGILTEPFKVYRGVKQGCPLCAVLYVLAISTLFNKMKQDAKIQGAQVSTYRTVKVMAYVDNITIIIKKQDELDIIYEYFKSYKEVAGAKLNRNKTEGVWIRESKPPQIDIEPKEEIKIWGIYLTNKKKLGEKRTRNETRA